MRILLFFDLPSVTTEDKRNYRKFVKNLKKAGFFPLQESVFTKLCANQTVADLTMMNCRKFLPKNGDVMSIIVTEKQYSSMQILLGDIETDVLNSDKKVVKL